MASKPRRPTGKPPRGAIDLENEGRYEYTEEYFDIRAQALITYRQKQKERTKRHRELLKEARPSLWEKNKTPKVIGSLDVFMKVNNNIDGRPAAAGTIGTTSAACGTTQTNLPGAQLSQCNSLPQSSEEAGNSSSMEGCTGICQ